MKLVTTANQDIVEWRRCHSGYRGRAVGVLIALLGLVGVGVAVAPSAQAHHVCTAHADGSYVCLGGNPNHGYLIVCDEDVDGNYAYARTYRNGALQDPLYDQTGAGGGCSLYEARVGTLDSFNVCVQNEGCGRPIYWWEF
jgi:hypothetical protein